MAGSVPHGVRLVLETIGVPDGDVPRAFDLKNCNAATNISSLKASHGEAVLIAFLDYNFKCTRKMYFLGTSINISFISIYIYSLFLA